MFSDVTVRCQGPAVTITITNRNGREYAVDLTLAIKHESWPEDAEEWRTRRRRGNVKSDILGANQKDLVWPLCALQGPLELPHGDLRPA